MPKTRAEKEQIVAELKSMLESMRGAVFTTVSGYTMDDADALREKGAETGVVVTMAKKTLLLKALKDQGIDLGKEDLPGSILTAIGADDAVAPAKLMAEFAKDRETIELVGGVLEGEAVSPEQVQTLATLPSREELYAKVVGSINAPVSGFVNVLAGNMRQVLYALNAIKETKA